MNEAPTHESGLRLVVVMPNWLGDGVMATPFLNALRRRNPQAHIAVLALPLIAPVVSGLACVDEVRIYDRRHEADAIRWLKAGWFEIGYPLPNSFRSAWMLWRGGVKQRIGYARQARGWLLTTRLRAQKRSLEEFQAARQRRWMQDQIANELRRKNSPPPVTGGRYRMHPMPLGQKFWPWRGYKPLPTIDYYLRLLDPNWPDDRSGDIAASRRMTLAVSTADRAEADVALASQGVDATAKLVMLVPGANFGSSKCWPPERFAQVADRLMDRVDAMYGSGRGATVLLAGAPGEKAILQAIVAASHLKTHGRLIDLSALNEGRGVSLGCLKALVERCQLMVCNDTGPRHFACAVGGGVPVVTLFGPTDPVWAETFYDRERQVRVEPPPPCGPCQLKRCPIDQRCLTGVTADAVLTAVEAVWPRASLDQERSAEPDIDPRSGDGSGEVA